MNAPATVKCRSATSAPMDALDAVDLGRQALLEMLVLSAPALLAAMLVGLLVGLIQALTQIQEQAVGFVPKFVALALVLSFTLPWLLSRLVEYTHDLFVSVPGNL